MGPYRNEPHYGTTQLKMIVLDLEVPTSSPSSQSSSSAGFPFHWRLLRLSLDKIFTLWLIKQCIVLVLGADNIAELAAPKTYNQGLIKKLSRSATDITSCARSANVWTLPSPSSPLMIIVFVSVHINILCEPGNGKRTPPTRMFRTKFSAARHWSSPRPR